MPPAAPNTPNNGNPFGNPNNGNPFGAPQQNGAAAKPKSASGVTGHVMTGVVAALVSAALCLGVGYAAITNGWVTVPTSSSLTSVKSNTSGSGSGESQIRRGRGLERSGERSVRFCGVH